MPRSPAKAGRRGPSRRGAAPDRTIELGGRAALLVLGGIVLAAAVAVGVWASRDGRLAVVMATVQRWDVPTPPPEELAAMEEDVRTAITTAVDGVTAERTSAAAWRGLGLVYGAHAMWPYAEPALRRAVQLAPSDALTAYYLAYVMAVKVEPLDATAAQYRRALALEPGYGPAWLGLGEVYAREGRLAEASEAYRAAVQAYGPPERAAIAHRELGLALLRSGDVEAAIAQLDAVMRVRPDDKATVAALAQAYNRLGQTERASQASATAARLSATLVDHDDKVAAMLKLASRRRDIERRIRDLVNGGDAAAALDAAKRWEQQHPDWPSIKTLIGDIYGHLGRADEAKRYLDAAGRLKDLGHTQ